MATICTSCMNTDISFQEGARPASLCYKHGCFVALEELITECADFDPNTCWLRQRVKELEAQLAEVNERVALAESARIENCVSGCPAIRNHIHALTEAHDKLRRIQTVDADWKWREMITKLQEYAYHYGDDALAEQLDELEIELICQEARIKFDGEVIDDEREKARLQRALDRIEAAGYTVHEMRVMDGYFCVWVKKPRHWTEYYGSGDTWAEAAEAAATWCESQKEGKA